ncbi:unnamed protein product [Oreochromis niloticus]|nr:unnamed protein product [Mustela putorius furo]
MVKAHRMRALTRTRFPERVPRLRPFIQRFRFEGVQGGSQRCSSSGINTSGGGSPPHCSLMLGNFDSVPTPAVKKVSVSSESCSLLCLVDRETKLLWFKDEQRLNQSSSALSLPLTVHKQDFNSSYRCVAANPAENKTLPVHVRTTCGDTNNDTNSSTEPRNYNILIIIFSVLSATLIIIIIILIMRRKHPVQDKFNLLQAAGRAPVDEVVLYTDTGDSRQGGILAAVSGTSDGSSLTAVSYKLISRTSLTAALRTESFAEL